MEFISKNITETCSIAKKIASGAKPGDIFCLKGDLGSGKTTFVQCFAKSLGVEDTVTSPTFVILKEYKFKKEDKEFSLVHVDCYRIQSSEDAESIGLNDYFKRKDIIMLIEWPERIREILPKTIKEIEFEYLEESKRKITLKD